MTKSATVAVEAIVNHVKSLLFDAKPPALAPELAELDGMTNIHDYLIELRTLLDDYAKGDFSRNIHLRGVVAGRLKAFQANILHLVWQVQQVARGDFSQKVEYLGELSTSFNSMVEQLDEALTTLKRKEEELTKLTSMLEQEVELRGAALKELSASEARFRYLAEHDPLTGVLNRRSFFDLATIELEKSAKKGLNCCLAIMDIDHFKLFNDTYGHIEGDAAIRHVIRISEDVLRREDFIGRYGGEEFVFLFSRANLQVGLNVAERIRGGIERTPYLIDGTQVDITVSIGLVETTPQNFLPHDNRYLPFVLGVADSALYEAKHNGRNQVRHVCLPDFSQMETIEA